MYNLVLFLASSFDGRMCVRFKHVTKVKHKNNAHGSKKELCTLTQVPEQCIRKEKKKKNRKHDCGLCFIGFSLQ